jgi:hypothetical protein
MPAEPRSPAILAPSGWTVRTKGTQISGPEGALTRVRRWRSFPTEVVGLVGVVLAFVGITAMSAFEQPPYFDADEKAHVGYAHEIADFRVPEIDKEPRVPESAVQWQAERATGRDDRYLGVWLANHPPLHYVVVAPLIWFSEATDRPDGGLMPMRLANLALAATGVVMTYLLAVELSGGIRRVGLAAAAIVALVPQGHTYFGRALNDGLAFAAGTGLVWAAARCLRRPRSRRDLLLLSALTAVAAGARTATMVLAVVVVGAVAVHNAMASGRSIGERLRVGALTVAAGLGPATALFGWFYTRIHLLYGDIGASTFLLERFGRTPRGSVLDMLSQGHRWTYLFHRMLSTAPLSPGWPRLAWPRFANLIAAVIVAGLVVLVVRARTGDKDHATDEPGVMSRRSLVLCLLAVAVITVTVAQHLSGGGSPYPRYFFPVLGVLAALAALSLDRLLPRILPALLVAAMAWWAIRQMPTGVDPTTLARPRDRGRGAPDVLEVLPAGPGWRVAAAALIGAGGTVAAGCLGAGFVGAIRQRIAGHRAGERQQLP